MNHELFTLFIKISYLDFCYQETLLMINKFNVKILFYAVLFSAMVFLICSVMSFVVTLIPDDTAVIVLFGGIPIFVGIIFNVQSSIIIEIFPTYIR